MKCRLCKGLRPGSIRFKLVCGMLVFWMAFILLSAVIGFYVVKTSNEELIAQKQAETVSVLADELDMRLAMMHDLLVAEAKGLTKDILSDTQKAQEWLNGQHGLHSVFDNHLFIFTPDGRLFVESPFISMERRGMDFSFREYIQKTLELKAPYLSNPYITSQAHKSPVVMFSAPVLDEHGGITAILAASLNLFGQNGLTHIRDMKIGQHGFMVMLSTDRRIIVHSNQARIYTYIEPGTFPIADRVLKEHFEGTLYEQKGHNNAAYLVTVKWLKYKDWVIMAHSAMKDVEQPIEKYQQFILLCSVVVLLTGIVFILWLANRSLEPLEAFAAHIRGLMWQKEKDRYFHYTGRDEIQEVSGAFNALIQELDVRYDELRKNREVFKALTLFSTDVIFWRGMNDELIYISPNCLALTGYTDAEFHEHAGLLEELILPEDTQLWTKHAHGRGEAVVFRIRHRTGRILWLRHECATILNEQGDAIGYRGNLIDITLQKLTELELAEQKDLLKHLIDALPVGVCLKNGRDRWLVANKQVLEMFGLPADLDYFQKDEAEIAAFSAKGEVLLQLKSLNEAAWQCKGLQRGYEEFVTSDGVKRTFDVFKVPVFNEDGSRKYLIVVSVDVTDLKQTEERLRQAQKMESVGQLAGGIAHDFNNILMAMQGYAELLKMRLTDSNLIKFVDHILKGSERAAQLVRHLLAFGRRQMLKLEHLNMNDVVTDIKPLLNKTIRDDIEMKIHLFDSRLPVYADRVQLEQVLINLLANARDAMPTGGSLFIETGLVQIDSAYAQRYPDTKPGDYVLLSISDTGCGMDDKIKAHVFDPFFTTKEFGKGTGLGLAIVQGIVAQHKGFITVYSETGVGTTFKIYLPLDKVSEDSTKQEAQKKQEFLKGKGVILLADDEEMVRDIALSVLKEAGYEVLTAKDGEEAVSLFEANADRVDLLILDVLMPRKNGRAAYEAIKARHPNIKAVFLSGYSEELLKEQGTFLNGCDFISKPISPHVLLEKIHGLLVTSPKKG
ncbi:MAG: ATP-binding protein [Dissulfuribacterales bacterium]